MQYSPADARYASMQYRRCGRTGLKLPAISLGFWHNFGATSDFANSRDMVLRAFDLGITHLDLANNYGPPAGAAESTFGKILADDLRPWRDELIIATKAGYCMWPGPYGDFGSRKYMLASLDQSLKRMGLEYVDIFYHHRRDPETPLEETMGALASAIGQGKALYVGLSSYDAASTRAASTILKGLGVSCLIHQPSYNMLDRWIEGGLLGALEDEGIGCMAFVPLAQGVLTSRYLGGIPDDSRAASASPFLGKDRITPQLVGKLTALDAMAKERGQSLAQMSLAWVLKDARVTSALIGASRPAQIEEDILATRNLAFSAEDLARIDTILK